MSVTFFNKITTYYYRGTSFFLPEKHFKSLVSLYDQGTKTNYCRQRYDTPERTGNAGSVENHNIKDQIEAASGMYSLVAMAGSGGLNFIFF